MTTSGTMSNATARLPLLPAPLGVLSIHLDGAACRVGCEFCYLGARAPSDLSSPPDGAGAKHLDIKMLEDVLSRLDYAEVAVAVSESNGTVRIFQDGEVVLRIEPFRRPMKWKDFEYEPPGTD